MGLEPCEAHWGGQNTTAPRREAQGQDRSAAREDQACAPDYPVILPGPRCRLYYRLLSKCHHGAAERGASLDLLFSFAVGFCFSAAASSDDPGGPHPSCVVLGRAGLDR